MNERKPSNLKLRQILPLITDEIIKLENTKGDEYKDDDGVVLGGLYVEDFYKSRKNLKRFLNYYVIQIESLISYRGYSMRITITSNKPKGKE